MSAEPTSEKPTLWPIRKRTAIIVLICVAVWTFAFSLDHSLVVSVLGALALAALLWVLPVAIWHIRHQGAE